ncbi:hypothetical protein LCGC14_1729740 [marine sediment metagenome]|uniref:Uncharacterized protein n=1 Tax=marine sediment metagenome TaxID=412755 RepID=A0A0F9K9N8_9ZZZZ
MIREEIKELIKESIIKLQKQKEIPVFDIPYRWYGVYRGCELSVACGFKDTLLGGSISGETIPRFNKSFAALAFNVARCIVVHGIIPHQVTSKEQAIVDNQCVKFREHAAECLERLIELYPDQVPDNCIGVVEAFRKMT